MGGMTEIDTIVLVVGVVAIAVVLALLGTRKKLVVFDWQSALLFRDGVLKRTLGPGTYRFFSPPNTWAVFDRRPQFLTIPGQEVLSRDALGVKITLVAEYQVEDAAKLIRSLPISSNMEVSNTIYPMLQLPVRDAAATYPLDEIITNRDALPELVRAACSERLANAGIKLLKVSVRDIMIAKELREAYAANAIAAKMSIAALERARSEVASMRALANAARMTQGNPELMQLRALQAMQASDGRHTVIFAFSGKGAPVRAEGAPGSSLGEDEDLL